MLYNAFSGVTATPCWAKSHLHILNRNMTSTKRTHSWTLVLWCWSTIPFATFMCLGQWAPSPLVNFVRFSRSTSVVRFFMFGFSLSSFFLNESCVFQLECLETSNNWSSHFWILMGLCLLRLTSLGLYLSDCQGLNSGTITVHVNTLYILYRMQNGSTFWYSERFAQIKVFFGVYNELIQIYVLSQHFLRRHELYFQSCQHVFVIHVITLTWGHSFQVMNS